MTDARKRDCWTAANIPSQRGRVIVITGTAGLGYECALALARAGAEIIFAGRDRVRGETSIGLIREKIPGAILHFEQLDLAELSSVEACGEQLRARCERIDVLINNAAVIMSPRRQVTKDGFELQFGTNYLGHFALTANLMPLLRKGDDSRVVNVCALAANRGKINFDDLQSEREYKPMAAYGQSKLANLIFSIELHRRSMAEQWGIHSIAAHPGLARSDLSARGINRSEENKVPLLFRLLGSLVLHSGEQGALPLLFAATAPEAKSGMYYGPGGLGETKGFPASAKVPRSARTESIATRLWDVSEQLTHTRYDAL
ncbi:SDR family oxidoreductase [Rhizobium sullae]|uniref:NAD(P)-dependent dehydrogenase (Short-subunit alcohol dehydrogenase family) n=1 Tax=Rhizobium sullae TaxID=50338 RepID=A0A4R3PS01_RHISU|nr:SDR family oxidoreductase [Rhizobium sullae]TCU06060.1 NAD(P)-dependent dehydrogenase (short-subunit alcohol dehydrogenase family) [Rhizobium sullae]